MISPDTEHLSPDRGRECDCPPWVIRCAHFEDNLVLSIAGDFPNCDVCGYTEESPGYFLVALLDRSDNCSGCHSRNVMQAPFYWGHFTDAANAAFETAEARLLAGGDA